MIHTDLNRYHTGQDVRDLVDLIENLKPNLATLINERLDSVKEIADKNQVINRVGSFPP